MRIVMLAVASLVLLVVGAVLWIDEGEVVTLVTWDEVGQHHETELWIAEYRGDLYLRGTPERAWMRRLRAEPRVELVRHGRKEPYEARVVEDPAVTAAVENVMARKYGSADRLAEAFLDHGPRVAVRLDPVADTPGPQS